MTLIALCIYAYDTRRIWKEAKKSADAANKTFGEVQKQTTLLRQQLAGTQAAIVSLNIPSGTLEIEPHPLARNVNISIGLKNDGQMIGKTVEIHLRVQMLRMKDKTYVGKQWPCDQTAPVVFREHIYKQCYVDGLTVDSLRSIENMTQTIAVDGEYTYNNGFDDIVKVPMCFRYVPQVPTARGLEGENALVSCDVFGKEWDIVFKGLAFNQKATKP